MKRTWIVACVLLGGCDQEIGFPGVTSVGNPGSSSQRVASGDDVIITAATVYTEALVIDRCNETVRIEVGAEVDLLAGDRVEVPGGQWCGMAVEWSAPLWVEGRKEEGTNSTFTLDLDATGPTVQAAAPFLIDGDALILRLGHPDWVSEEDLGLEDGQHTTIQGGDPLHDLLLTRIEDGSALFVDADGDGQLDDGGPPVAAGPLAGDGDDDSGER